MRWGRRAGAREVRRIREFGERARASAAFRRLLGGVEQERRESTERNHRGAKAVIDQHAAARLSAVVGDGEFPEHAVAPDGAVALEAARAPAPAGRATPVTAIAAASLLCLWAGARANHDFGNTVTHAAADGGSFGTPTAAAGPMFGAGRDPGETGGDPAMTPKKSARVVAMAAAAAVTANGALAGDAVQWRVEDGGNGHWYRTVTVPGGVTWESARQSAALLGGQLTCLESDLERTFCFTRFSRFSAPEAWVAQSPGAIPVFGPWIGGYQLPNSAEPLAGWTWITGSVFNPSWPWACCNNDCPGSSNEDRLQMFFSDVTNETSWNDLPNVVTCGAQPISFLVEWSADCNSDGIVDYGQILTGALADANSNGVPDTCECATNPSLPYCCPGDIYRNGRVDGADLGALLSEWGPVTPLTNSDLDGNGQVNGADLGILLAHWGPCGG